MWVTKRNRKIKNGPKFCGSTSLPNKILLFSNSFILLAIIMAIITLATWFFVDRYYQTGAMDIPKIEPPGKTPSILLPTANKKGLKPEMLIPESILLPVPFTPQAPTANWDQLHNEACEEAAALMANAYFKGFLDETLKPVYVENEINLLTEWLKTHYGYYLDTTSAETARMMSEVYGLNTKLVENFTADDLKKALAQNRLVLISTLGRLLGNPYYKRPGPVHHMLILKGYNEQGFITNDPGTKRGLNYFYTFDTLYNAAADWEHTKNTVNLDKKIAIIVWQELK